MVVAVEARPEPAPRVADPAEDEHPAAAQLELGAVAGVGVDGVEDPDPEDDQGDPDDPGHDGVDPVRQEAAEQEGGKSQDGHHRRVPQGVQRAEHDGVALFGGERGPGRGRDRERSHGGSLLAEMGRDLARPAVRVVVRARLMLGFVRQLGRFCCRGRAGDVGDRGDVIPVDPVPDAEHQGRRQERDRVGRIGDGCDGVQESSQPVLQSSRGSKADDYCSSLQ